MEKEDPTCSRHDADSVIKKIQNRRLQITAYSSRTIRILECSVSNKHIRFEMAWTTSLAVYKTLSHIYRSSELIVERCTMPICVRYKSDEEKPKKIVSKYYIRQHT